MLFDWKKLKPAFLKPSLETYFVIRLNDREGCRCFQTKCKRLYNRCSMFDFLRFSSQIDKILGKVISQDYQESSVNKGNKQKKKIATTCLILIKVIEKNESYFLIVADSF